MRRCLNGTNARNCWPVGPPCAQTIVGTRRAPRLPVAPAGRQSVPSRASPSRALSLTRSATAARPGASAARSTAGIEIGHLPRPRSIRRDARDGQQPQVLRRGIALADRGDPGAVREPPDGPPDAVPRIDPAARRRVALTVRGTFGGRPRPRLGGCAPPSSPTSRSCRPSWTSMWTNRLPSGDGSGTWPAPPPGSPCSRSPAVRTIRSCPSAVSRTTWNQPSASDTNRSEPSAIHSAPTSRLRSPATTLDAPRRDVDQRDLGGLEVLLALAHDRDPARRRAPR